MYGPGIRRRSLGHVLKEIDAAVTQGGIRSIYFYDLEFSINKRYVEQLCDALIERRYPLRWCCQTRVTDVDENILARMKRAGCRLIHFGVESGSQRILDQIKKETTLADAERAIRLTKQVGIESLCFFMLGFEGETPEEMQETIRFASRLSPTYVSFHVTSPHEAIEPHPVGTQRILALRQDDLSFDRGLKRRVRQALWRFYLRPASLLHRFRQLLWGDWRMLLAQLRLFRGYFTT